jgi:hypothetical protein
MSTMGHKDSAVHNGYSQSKTSAKESVSNSKSTSPEKTEPTTEGTGIDIAGQIECLEALLTKGFLTQDQFQTAVTKVIS